MKLIFDGQYELYENGDMYRLPLEFKDKNGRIVKLKYKKLSLQKYSNGYAYYNAFNRAFLVHRLIAMAFIPNPNNYKFVNHKNGIRDDNRIENLEWCTISYNHLHAYNVLKRKPTWLGKTGADNYSSKRVAMFDGDTWNRLKELIRQR